MSRLRTLVLDDDKNFRDLFVDLFTRQGYEAISVVTGEEALCKIQEERFDLAALDFNLPGWVDGIDFLKELKSLSPNTEVILLTGHASEEGGMKPSAMAPFTIISNRSITSTPVAKALESHRLNDGPSH